MELFMYKCNKCGTVKLSDVDYGSVWHSICGTCGRQTFYEKVVVQQKRTLINKEGFREDYIFVLEKSLYGKEKKNGDSKDDSQKR